MKNDYRIRVLYVEDNADSFDMLQVMLASAGIDLVSAGSIAEALTQAGRERFDLYLLDSGLPDGSGVSLCRTLRAVEPVIPILFYSGSAYVEEIELGLSAGADGYMLKPHSEKLGDTIGQLVAARRGQPSVVASLPVIMPGVGV
jgi:two-component system OmpR family response regulator